MKKSLVLAVLAIGTALAQQQNPLEAIPAPLVGALIDLYTNYQANRPQLPQTQQSAAYQEQRRRDRNTKVTTGVAVGAAIGALIATPNDRGKAAAIGAVAGGLLTLLLDQAQAKRYRYDEDRFDDSRDYRYNRQAQPEPLPDAPPSPRYPVK